MKKDGKKILHIIELILGAIILLCLLLALVLQLVDPTLPLSVWSLESLQAHLPVIIQSVIYIFLVLAISKILRTIFKSQISKSDRTKTVVQLFDGLVKYGSAIIIIILVLNVFGVDTKALIASVGVLALIIGLGAQTLISDIIAGVFIIFENEFHTGETISIDGFRGKVTEIGIRSTKLLDAAGNIKIVNHSSIGDVVNLSRELSLAIVDCDFPYDVPIEHIENLFEKKFPIIAEKIPAIIEGPFYKGVCEYKDSNVTVKIVAKCLEDDRFQVQRDLMREYRSILTEEGIDISYIQVVVNQPEPKKQIKVSKKGKDNADQFVEEQKELSVDLEEQHN